MRIFNTAVYGLEESIVRSGYPMRTEIDDDLYKLALSDGYDDELEEFLDTEAFMKPHLQRAVKLASCKTGSGHNNFLKGIIVQCDVEAPSYVWPQIQRYRFFEIISSTSKMHTLKIPEGKTYEEVLSKMTMDYELTAGITTNYMCLRNMYWQRKNHRLKFWTEAFCPWVESLPMAKELILCDTD